MSSSPKIRGLRIGIASRPSSSVLPRTTAASGSPVRRIEPRFARRSVGVAVAARAVVGGLLRVVNLVPPRLDVLRNVEVRLGLVAQAERDERYAEVVVRVAGDGRRLALELLHGLLEQRQRRGVVVLLHQLVRLVVQGRRIA